MTRANAHRRPPITIPKSVIANCRRTPEGAAWLRSLPDLIGELEHRWDLTLGDPFDGSEVSCGWVTPAARADGTSAVLKVGMPHMEALQEIDGLRFWDGDPTVMLLEADDDENAMLLERCEPGSMLRMLPEPEQDHLIANLLKRIWREPPEPHRFRPLSEMTAYWSKETLRDAEGWSDPGLVREGLRLFEELPRSRSPAVLLATDLHAGNVLAAKREPWLVIDPKPFVGEPAYDATQHLFNCLGRLRADPDDLINRFADLVDLEPDRVKLWTFARAAAEPRDRWDDAESIAFARALSP